MKLLRLFYAVFLQTTYVILVFNIASQTTFAASMTRMVSSKPSTPDKPQASYDTYSYKVLVTWGKVNGATSYKVFRCSATSTRKCGSGVQSNTYTYDDSGAKAGVTYYYRIKACKLGRCSNFSAADTGRVKPTKPSRPSKPRASDNTYTDKIKISWNRVDGATSYELFRYNFIACNNCDRTFNSTRLFYDDTSAIAGTSYRYQLRACNQVGCSSYSSPDGGNRKFLGTDQEAPAKPVASDGQYYNKIHITWETLNGPSGSYQIFRCHRPTSTTQCIKITQLDALSFDDTRPRRGQINYYRIKRCYGGTYSNNCGPFSPSDAGSKN